MAGGWKPAGLQRQPPIAPLNVDEIARALKFSNLFEVQEPQLPRPEEFQAVVFAGTWADTGAPYENTAYYRDGFGVVHLVGHPTGGAYAAGGSTIFTLADPLLDGRYFPKNTVSFSSVEVGTGGWVAITIDSAGAVVVKFGARVAGNYGAIPLGHIAFRGI